MLLLSKSVYSVELTAESVIQTLNTVQWISWYVGQGQIEQAAGVSPFQSLDL